MNLHLLGELVAGAIGSEQRAQDGMLVAFTVFLLALVILLAVGLFIMYRKCQEVFRPLSFYLYESNHLLYHQRIKLTNLRLFPAGYSKASRWSSNGY